MMPTVLFLCSGNYYRSRFAEAYFNHRAAELGLPHRAESRGFRLGANNFGPISPHAAAGLQQLGIALPSTVRFPAVVVEDELCAAARVIAVKETEHRPLMQQHFPALVEQVEYWQIDDIDCAEPAEALPHLLAKLDALLAGLRPATPDSA